MKREFIGEILKIIYVDISLYEGNIIAILSKHNNKIRYEYPKTLNDTLEMLKATIDPRYTKVILDCSPDITNIIQKWIDIHFNHYIKKIDTMLEMVAVETYRHIKIDVEKILQNKTITITEKAKTIMKELIK